MRSGSGRSSVEAGVQADIDLEVFHRRVDELFDGDWEPMDLVDEQDIAGLQPSQHRDQIGSPRQRRARCDMDLRSELSTDHVREGRFSQSGRAVEQDVLQVFTKSRCRLLGLRDFTASIAIRRRSTRSGCPMYSSIERRSECPVLVLHQPAMRLVR